VATIAARHAPNRPELDELTQGAADLNADQVEGDSREGSQDVAVASLWAALREASEHGRSVKDLMTATGMGRSWVYARLQELAAAGTVTQVARGRWVLVDDGTARR
jgi:DNA segregation ATPase FtsK/SpoIIIE, S-DNA-T family